MKEKVWFFRYFPILVVCLLMVGVSAQYYPDMEYGEEEEIYSGVTWQTATNPDPDQNIVIIRVDMDDSAVHLRPVFKSGGNVEGEPGETTSTMATRVDGVAAVNAGYGWGGEMTNSYTRIDDEFIGGSGEDMLPENNRSVVGFSDHRQEIAVRTKLQVINDDYEPEDPEYWDEIVDAIGGRGHFVTEDGDLVVQDNEGTGDGHHGDRHPRTAIGFTREPYTVYLVTVDGRQPGFSEGMTYEELGQLMADLGVEESISLDGGGSTTAWVRREGVVNSISEDTPRRVISSWVVVPEYRIDHTDDECQVSGAWDVIEEEDSYYHDSLVADGGDDSMTVTWTPDLPREGAYEVYVHYLDGEDFTSEAQFVVSHDEGETEREVDQQTGGGEWHRLGNFTFAEGTEGSVQLVNTAQTDEKISADGVKFVHVGDPLEDLIIDNEETGYTDIVGNWELPDEIYGSPWEGSYHRHWGGGDGSETFSWYISIPESGVYDVQAHWVAGENRNDNVQYIVEHAEGEDEVFVDQTDMDLDATWVSLGEYVFEEGEEARVTVTDKGEGVIIADAVRFDLLEPAEEVTSTDHWQLYK